MFAVVFGAPRFLVIEMFHLTLLGVLCKSNIFIPESFSSSCLMIWAHNIPGLIWGDVHQCENYAVENATNVSAFSGNYRWLPLKTQDK